LWRRAKDGDNLINFHRYKENRPRVRSASSVQSWMANLLGSRIALGSDRARLQAIIALSN
jgi:hypothetical protein